MTRAQLAAKTKVPERTLQDCELGRFRLTKEVVMKILYTTGADPFSLLREDDPILDCAGKPLSAATKKADANTSPRTFRAREIVMKHLCESAWETALERKVGRLLLFSFESWLNEMCVTYNLFPGMHEKLTERLGLFDPSYVDSLFQPTDKKLSAEWSDFEKRVDLEEIHVYLESHEIGVPLDEDQMTKRYVQTYKIGDPIDEERKEACRRKALERVRRQREDAKTDGNPPAPKKRTQKPMTKAMAWTVGKARVRPASASSPWP
jgi:hypothetical protein